MKEQIENALTRVADSARTTVNTAVDATQERVGQAGKVIATSKKPVTKLSKASIDVNDIGFRLSKDLIKLQTKTVTGSLDAIANGFDAAASADSVGSLLAYQRDTLPKVVRGYMTDIREAFDLVRGAATDVTDVVVGLGKKSAPKRAKAAAKKTARKVARKTPVKKTKKKTKAAANTAAQKVAEVKDTVKTA